MGTTSRGPRVGGVRLLRILIVVLPLCALFWSALWIGIDGEISDSDELWHLATGRVIALTGAVPAHDPFTFTAGDTPWTNTNWLAQLVLWRLYQVGGIELDWLAGMALLFGSVALAHERARRRTRSALATLPVPFFVLAVVSRVSTVRPQGWTFLLLALALLLADLVSTWRGAAVLALVIALSAQMHGGFIFVLAAVLTQLASRRDGGERRLLAGAAAVGLVLAAAHPHGLAALVYPVKYALDPRVTFIFPNTRELAPPDLAADPWLGPILLVLVAAALSGCRASRGDVLALIAFAALAFHARRAIQLLAIVAAAPIGLALDDALEGCRAHPRIAAALDAVEPFAARWASLVPLALALALAGVAVEAGPRIAPGKPGDLTMPRLRYGTYGDVAAVTSWLAVRDPPGRMWNELEDGGALIWNGWPRRRVLIDGRGDFNATAGTFEPYLHARHLDDGWEADFERYGCDLALIGHGPLAAALGRKGWRNAWDGNFLELRVRPGSAADRVLR